MKIINNSKKTKCDISAGVYFVFILNSKLLVFSSKNRVICLRIKIVQGKGQGKLIQNSNKIIPKISCIKKFLSFVASASHSKTRQVDR